MRCAWNTSEWVMDGMRDLPDRLLSRVFLPLQSMQLPRDANRVDT